MKRLLVTVALAIVAVPSFGALQYEFSQKVTSEDIVSPVTDFSARVTIDGQSSRIDYIGGSIYPPGAYAVSTDGSRRIFFVDPTKQWFTEVNTSNVATALGTSNIKIENFKSSVATEGDRPLIAGIPADDHTRVSMTYDVSVIDRGVPMKVRVKTEIDSWSTSRFGDVVASTFAANIRTGSEQIDALLDAEMAKLKGLPLKQILTTRIESDLPNTRSEIKVPRTQTVTREMEVTSVREVTADASMFVVPASFRRADVPQTPKAAAQVLTFDPPSKP